MIEFFIGAAVGAHFLFAVVVYLLLLESPLYSWTQALWRAMLWELFLMGVIK